uniref:DUF3857 domain-containing protein n=1 Tax=candidate division WOR-3 bacterium TaxID=2052148 RepID=A0A7C4TI60_UNCW3
MLIIFLLILQYNFNPQDYPDASGLIVRECISQYYDLDYKFYQEYEYIVHIFNIRGRERYGDMFEKYNREKQTLELLKAQTITADGKGIKPDEKAISDLGTVEGFLASAYKDLRTRTVSYSNVEPGATLEYKSVKKSKESDDRHISGIVVFKRYDPILHKSFKLKVPKHSGLKDTVLGDIKRSFREEGDYLFYEWSADSVPRLKEERFSIPREQFCPRVLFSNYKDWKEVGEILYKNFKKAIVITKEIKERANSFPGNNQEITEQVYDYICKNWRDIPIGIWEAGFKPMGSDEVYKNRYGNQLDKCCVLIALLKARGIESYPAFVSLSDVSLSLPMPDHFYSVVVAIPKEEGFIFLDPRMPERETQSLDVSGILGEFNYGFPLLSDIVGRFAFIVKPDTQIFSPLPEYKTPIAIIEMNCELNEDGSLRGNIKANLKGLSAIMARASLRHKKEKELNIGLESLLGSIKTKTELKGFQITGLDEPRKEVEMEIEFLTPDYLIKQGKNLRFYIPLSDFLFFEIEKFFGFNERTNPFTVVNSREAVLKINLKYPEDYEVYYHPKDISVENTLGSATNSFAVDSHTIKITRRFAFKKSDYSAIEYPLLKSIYDACNSNEQKYLIFSKGKR